MSTTTTRTIQHRIGGAETTGSSRRTAPVYDPATGEQQAEVVLAEREDVDRAVQTAKTAFETWGDVSLTRRARVMFAFKALVENPVMMITGISAFRRRASRTTVRPSMPGILRSVISRS